MAQDSATPSTPVGTADVANASALVESISVIRQALGDNSDAVVTAITAIATAVTQSLIGGVVGTTTNRVLRAKTVSSGSSAGSVQNSAVTIDDQGNISTPGTELSITDTVHGNAGIKLGNVSGSATTPYIDFHSGATAATYDARIIASGGSGVAAGGTLNFDVATLNKSNIGVATLNTNTWLQQQGFVFTALTDAATIAWDVRTAQSAHVTLTAGVGATRVLGAPTNLVTGFTYILYVQQSSGGANALTYNGVYKWPAGVAPTLSTAANAIDILTFVTDGSSMYGVAQKGFA